MCKPDPVRKGETHINEHKKSGNPAKRKTNTVYLISLIVTFALALWSVVFNESFVKVTSTLFSYLSTNMGWLYLLVIAVFVAFCLILAFGKYGSIRLGPDDSRPEYSTFSWFAMLFCAGMGVGLVFWGVSEPLSHFISPDGMEGGTAEATAFAMKATFMHWGIHPWAIYGILGLSIAYFGFRKGEKNLISSAFIPLIGRKRAEGGIGKAVDVLTIVITVTGISTTLGLSALQINGGLSSLIPGMPTNLKTQIIIIAIVTVAFLCSAISGVNKGIKHLSNFNLILAIALAAFAFAVGPKIQILNNFVSGMGDYISGIVKESLNIHTYSDNSWVINWRVFYWAWWISWAPFVGCFTARISRGRTIREFVLGVLVVPAVASCVWFSVFGSLGINLGINGIIPLETLGELIATPETALFAVLNEYPLGAVLSVMAVLLLCTFFVTSADSGTFVLGMFSSDGQLDPSNVRKVTWGIAISVLAVGLLISGGLKSVQTVSIVIAFPFLFIMLACCWAIVKSLKNETTNFNTNTEDKKKT